MSGSSYYSTNTGKKNDNEYLLICLMVMSEEMWKYWKKSYSVSENGHSLSKENI